MEEAKNSGKSDLICSNLICPCTRITRKLDPDTHCAALLYDFSCNSATQGQGSGPGNPSTNSKRRHHTVVHVAAEHEVVVAGVEQLVHAVEPAVAVVGQVDQPQGVRVVRQQAGRAARHVQPATLRSVGTMPGLRKGPVSQPRAHRHHNSHALARTKKKPNLGRDLYVYL